MGQEAGGSSACEPCAGAPAYEPWAASPGRSSLESRSMATAITMNLISGVYISDDKK